MRSAGRWQTKGSKEQFYRCLKHRITACACVTALNAWHQHDVQTIHHPSALYLSHICSHSIHSARSRVFLAGKIHWKNTAEQLKLVGPSSLGVALLTAGFVGMVFTIQVRHAHAHTRTSGAKHVAIARHAMRPDAHKHVSLVGEASQMSSCK